MTNCPYCSMPNPDGTIFCVKCGRQMAQQASPAQQPPAVQQQVPPQQYVPQGQYLHPQGIPHKSNTLVIGAILAVIAVAAIVAMMFLAFTPRSDVQITSYTATAIYYMYDFHINLKNTGSQAGAGQVECKITYSDGFSVTQIQTVTLDAGVSTSIHVYVTLMGTQAMSHWSQAYTPSCRMI